MSVGAWASILDLFDYLQGKIWIRSAVWYLYKSVLLMEIFKMQLKSYTEAELHLHSPSQKWGTLYSRYLFSSCIAFTWAVKNLCLNKNALLNVDHRMSILCFVSGIICQVTLCGGLKQEELFPFLPLGKTENADFSSKVLLHEKLVFMWKICL